MDKKLKEVKKQIDEKSQEYNELDRRRNEVAQELIKLQGQLELLQELCQKQ